LRSVIQQRDKQGGELQEADKIVEPVVHQAATKLENDDHVEKTKELERR